MRYKKLKDPIYKSEIHVITDCSYKDMGSKLKRLCPDIREEAVSEDSLTAEAFKLIHSNGFKEYGVWFLNFSPKKAETLYTIVHEASHLVDKIFEDRGVKNDTEARAYFLEYLVVQIWRFCGQRKKR